MRKFVRKVNHDYVSWSLALIVILQNPPWPLWGIGLLLGYILPFFVLCYLYYINNSNYLLEGIGKKYFPILYFAFFFLFVSPLLYGFRFSSIFIFVTYILLFRINNLDLCNALRILTNIVAVIVLFSLPFWLIHVFIFELPTYGTIDISEMKGAAYVLNNHFLFLTYDGLDFFRFYSVFDEPGVLGTLSAFILFGNRFNMKRWQNIVILLGGIFTYSMAFYVLTLLGYFYCNLFSIKKIISSLLIFACLTFVLVFLLKDDLAFSLSVIERFQDFGLNRIENRTGEVINEHFMKMLYSPLILFGEGPSFLIEHSNEVGASYKLFIIEYGFLGVSALFFMYYSLIPIKNRDTLFFLFLFSLSFLQRPYAFTSWQLVIFAMVIASLNRNYTNYIVK